MSETIKLPDLPRPPIHLSGWTNELCEWAKDYARRAVEQNTAELRAERDALRAEVDALRSRLVVAEEAAERCKAVCDMTSEGWRAERDALRADAERYQFCRANRLWLRAQQVPLLMSEWEQMIDAARAALKEEK